MPARGVTAARPDSARRSGRPVGAAATRSSGEGGGGRAAAGRAAAGRAATGRAATGRAATGRAATGRTASPSARGSARRRTSGTASRNRSRYGSTRRGRGPGLPVRLVRAGYRLLAAIWLLIAHLIGGIVRRAGGSARGLDPAHRRDGLGLAALAGAGVLAVGVWAHAGGPVGRGSSELTRWFVGSGAAALPLALLAAAWRLLRRPADPAARGRALVGSATVCLGLLGILALIHADPVTSAGRANAGGIFGFLAAAPLASALTPYLAGPLLGLVAGFGVLVLTATPAHAIPARARTLAARLRRRSVRAAPDALSVQDTQPIPGVRHRPSR
ncbi:MAG TPA: DNA translocase FtsK 4TM domain-containing protein, partial [Mycobacteriales bacterium]|nr:DNA translocase FtsK 4TM domain-containing protein [Mycobacteriales bacterium]